MSTQSTQGTQQFYTKLLRAARKRIPNVSPASLKGNGTQGEIRIGFFGLCHLPPSRSPTCEASMTSECIEDMFVNTPSDAIIMYDACGPAGCSLRNLPTPRAGGGVTELIAACGFNNNATGPGPNSFTQALIEVLSCASDNKIRLSVSQLSFQVLRKLRSRRNDGSRTATPVHSTLRSDENGRQIFLHPLSYVNEHQVSQQLAPLRFWESPSNFVISFDRRGSEYPGPEWEEWLLQAPADATKLNFHINCGLDTR
ncbi:hypothetical protein HYALB_00012856 [Hymenoscyphus albidus]|uniref:Uncharacterized protein n=1 Tax=Hymenoscyphus albidus TaxID=595503 RepID=A0A9N9LRB1_9HELO|nr:hypothetical protein HYALB_00012856 [Hymenoscyphus albidus]